MLKVLKFGGSSMADAQQYEKIKSIVEADLSRRVVVVSAAGKRFSDDHKLTDLLYLCYAHLQYGVSCDSVWEMITQRYLEIRDALQLQTDLEREFAQLREKMDKKAITQDELVSRGEYFSARLMADYLGFEFLDSVSWLKFKFDGTVDQEKSYALLRELAGRKKVVIPGFYGMGKDGNVKTFSRGGSDVTGSIVARASRADVYENWTDVSGFLVADPRIVPDPKPIKYITYRELRELSYMGASVLHEDAIFPVRSCGIPINIKNTNAPEDAGTWIVESTCQKQDYVVTGIAGKKDFCTIFITKAMMNSEIGFGRKVLQAFEENNISFEHMPSGIDTMTIVVHADEFIDKEQSVVSAIHRLAEPDSVEIESGLALIAVVGRGMKSASGTAGKLFTALANKGINIKMIDQGSSELNIIIGVENRDFETAIKAIYSTFITK